MMIRKLSTASDFTSGGANLTLCYKNERPQCVLVFVRNLQQCLQAAVKIIASMPTSLSCMPDTCSHFMCSNCRPHHSPMRRRALSPVLHEWGNWGTERLSGSATTMELWKDTAGELRFLCLQSFLWCCLAVIKTLLKAILNMYVRMLEQELCWSAIK